MGTLNIEKLDLADAANVDMFTKYVAVLYVASAIGAGAIITGM